MGYLESLSPFEMAGIILQLVVLPLLVMKLRLFWWAKQSMQWPKVYGKVIKGIIFRMPRSLDFLFTYEINGTTYQGDKPFFYNSYKTLNVKKVSNLMDTYPEGKQVVVYYNPSNHKIATLEPGRMDGVLGALALLFLLFALGFISFYNPSLLIKLIDNVSKF
tara:strand:- start:1765 stop:2250 length:486 start_codon:yes stop_codon:yes gene_type:complete